ncbi:hypothetical protein JGU66_04370 [Myxococcaceae bacterium JPH2]|nr:hypothetical protein [Myxococcaceae bacterium JPH2]
MTPPMTESRWTRVAWGWLGGALVLLAFEAARLALHKSFSIDEFQYAHSAWLMAHGQVPYRDFFEVHLPLVYQLLAPLFWVWGDAPSTMLVLRAAMLVPLAGAALAVWGINRREGSVAALLAPVLLLSLPSYVRFATEVRPDALSTALFLGALAALSSRTLGKGACFSSGALLVAAAWASQKVLFHGGLVGLVSWGDAAWRRGRPPARLGSPRAFLAGAGSVLALVAVYLTLTASWGATWRWCFAWAAEHQRHYPGFSWRDFFVPAVREQPVFFILAALGFARVVWTLVREGPARWSHPDAVLVLAVPATFGAYALQRAPFPYSLLPFLGVLAPLAARGAMLALMWPRTLGPRIEAAVGLGALLALQATGLEHLLDGGDNARQREVLARIGTLTNPEDVVYDNAGGAVSRPHAHFYFYTDAYLRGSIAEQLAREVPEALVSRGCVLRVDDLRTPGLPPTLRAFLDAHYQPLDGDLYLWGQRYDASGAEPLEDRFLAVREDRYFVEPAQVLAHGTLVIDGARVTTPEFSLSRGEHTVRYEGPAGRFHLLWLPRDGQRWHPRPGVPATFSRLF